jgi:hypothetical protein
VLSTFEFLHTCYKFLSGAYRGGGVFMLKSSSPSCCGFLHLFLMSMFGIVNFYQGVGKSVRLCAFELHHMASSSLCDNLLQICAYYLVRNSR